MPICSLSTVSLTRNTPPACLGVAKGHGSLALVWGTWVRVRGSPAAVGVAPSEGQRWLAGGCALSCCGRSGGAGRSPGGTVGRCAAAGSTVGSSRHGHRRGRPSGPVERERAGEWRRCLAVLELDHVPAPGARLWMRKPGQACWQLCACFSVDYNST